MASGEHRRPLPHASWSLSRHAPHSHSTVQQAIVALAAPRLSESSLPKAVQRAWTVRHGRALPSRSAEAARAAAVKDSRIFLTSKDHPTSLRVCRPPRIGQGWAVGVSGGCPVPLGDCPVPLGDCPVHLWAALCTFTAHPVNLRCDYWVWIRPNSDVPTFCIPY